MSQRTDLPFRRRCNKIVGWPLRASWLCMLDESRVDALRPQHQNPHIPGWNRLKTKLHIFSFQIYLRNIWQMPDDQDCGFWILTTWEQLWSRKFIVLIGDNWFKNQLFLAVINNFFMDQMDCVEVNYLYNIFWSWVVGYWWIISTISFRYSIS